MTPAEELLIEFAIAWRKAMKESRDEGELERRFWYTVDQLIKELEKKCGKG